MNKILKISLIQAEIIWENIEANLSHFSDLLARVEHETDIVILPEMFATGFTMNTTGLAEGFNDKVISWMRKSAALHNFTITGSMIFSEENGIFNRLIWMNPSGTFSFYDKRHLFRMGMENKHYSPGNSKLIIDFGGWKICPLICYDLRFPVWSRNAEGYDLLIYVANWPSVRSNVWNTLLRARAIENQCYLAAVNRVGNDGEEIEYSGESMILDPHGQLLTQASENKEMVISASIDLDKLNDLRKKFPVSKDSDRFNIID